MMECYFISSSSFCHMLKKCEMLQLIKNNIIVNIKWEMTDITFIENVV